MLWNPDAEAMDRDRLRDLQAARLREKVAYVAERVPFYRERFAAHGIAPDDVQSVDDLARLPFTTKSDLRDNYPFGLFAVPQSAVVRIHASSGTKGKLTVVGYTRHDLGVWAEVAARALTLGGGQPGDVIHNAYGYGLFTGGLGMHYGGELMGATVVPMSGGNTPRQVMLLKDFGAKVLCCTPSYALTIADEMERQGIDPKELPLSFAILGAEPWTEEMRGGIEERLAIAAVDIYGLSEIIGPGVACECIEARHGLHIAEDHFLPEIINPETGDVLPPGEQGELVLTCLTKEAFPLIRYRTGDITALIPEPCTCGRTSMRMARLRGRHDDMLIVRGVNVYPSEVEAVLLGMGGIAPFYQIILDREGTLDTMEVMAEVTPSFHGIAGWALNPDHPAVRELHGRLVDALKSRLGLTCRVMLVEPGGMERIEVGKAVRVVDRRQLS
ncbi:MAG: phenylacetate--CoA ligase [Chloroflexota bacterium]|nr:phenylacetate--CoA ligase [Chloroflexota bacterium]